jgi:SAM-dependent MidA family methyltransferase
MQTAGPVSLSARLRGRLLTVIAQAGGWLPFDRFMAMALYEPGLGYYARDARQFGTMPASGSDFVTAPELSPLFGKALARQVAQALEAAGADEVFEFGAGSGALAAQLIGALGGRVRRYSIVDLSGTLRAAQAVRLAAFEGRVRWLDAWPEELHGVVIGNEVLDAMPVQLLHFDGQAWQERGVAATDDGYAWAERPTALKPPHDAAYVPGTVTEIHPQAEAFIRSLAARLQRGAAFFIDYGFPEAEYYHPQRSGGTLMCHRAHLADADPLVDVGDKDITAHVNFSGMALAAQDAGLDVIGYTTQAHFLLNCGLLDLLPRGDHRAAAAVQKLLNEHEMGELFKVIGLARGITLDPLGFAAGDRSHTL